MTQLTAIHQWHQPQTDELGHDVIEFLRRLRGPTWITINGQDNKRWRVFSTLLHGNEPSGAKAVFDFLKSGLTPRVNTAFFLGSIEAALHPPLFAYRHLPSKRDLNRCFKPPFTDDQGKIASHLLALIGHCQPEAIIDAHNTSGISPSFGVCTFDHWAHRSLISLFAPRMIISDLRIGALMEISGDQYPVVTVECGGARSPESDALAIQGLRRFLQEDDVLSPNSHHDALELFQHPVRIELSNPALEVAYDVGAHPEAAITLAPNVEQYNFGIVNPDTALGWLGQRGLGTLTAKDAQGNERLADYFTEKNGQLYPSQALKLFMVTTNPTIAQNDCLFYAVTAKGH